MFFGNKSANILTSLNRFIKVLTEDLEVDDVPPEKLLASDVPVAPPKSAVT